MTTTKFVFSAFKTQETKKTTNKENKNLLFSLLKEHSDIFSLLSFVHAAWLGLLNNLRVILFVHMLLQPRVCFLAKSELARLSPLSRDNQLHKRKRYKTGPPAVTVRWQLCTKVHSLTLTIFLYLYLLPQLRHQARPRDFKENLKISLPMQS